MVRDDAYRAAEEKIEQALRDRATELSLHNMGLTELPDSLGQLTKLQGLNVTYNQLTSLPESLGQLTKLKRFYVYGNQLTSLPEWLGQLTKLQLLSVFDNQLTSLPELLGQLTQLQELYVYHNQLTSLPESLGQLTRLLKLCVHENELTKLPDSLRNLPSLKYLDVASNPKLGLPAEIVKTDDARKILDYYFRTAAPGAAQPLNEFKLILVGRGLVGKTTLVHRIITNKFKKFQRTPGIKITKWPTRIDGDEVRAHVWDFGGQEIMHGTHRFFMTERALYLVLISGREGTEDHDAEYWLSLVRSFAGNDAPVIVLLHKWDDFHFELNRELLRDKYGKNIVFLETDSSTGHGIRELRKQICQLAKNLPGLKAVWPTQWRQIKEDLPAEKKSWLTFDDFCAFCRRHEINELKDQEALAESLHDLGLMLSYRRDEALRHFGVLNPQWVTKGIYEIINSSELRDAGGKFTVRSFTDVLPQKEYPKELHPYLLALMRKFRLCHPLDDKGDKHLIPELLTKEEPKLEPEFPPKECLGFIYSYDSVLPEGLLPRFIVETYVHREPKRAWRTGVVLERANCRALVRGDVQGRKIAIRVIGVGNGRRELLGIIRAHFERIHKSYEKLPVTELVPIPGYPESHVGHESLLKYERLGREMIAVEIGEEVRDFRVKELLDGVDLPGAPRSGMLLSELAPEFFCPTTLFISYSHKDAVFLDQLRGALVPYERIEELMVWSDPLIEPGQQWEQEILDKLGQAQIVVLLLSNDFMRSCYCMEKELARALERHQKGECTIVPVVVRACRFDKLPLGQIQAIQPSGKPVDEHDKVDRAWHEVTKQLDRVIERLKKPPADD